MAQTVRLRSSQPPRKRLPQLKPYVNKQARQIIKAHMRHSSTNSSELKVSLLQKIENTASRCAPTHDISHLLDKPSHLTPSIPASLIKEEHYVYEATFMPKDGNSVYSDLDGLWHTRIFPSDAPSSRADVIMLDAWITKSLQAYENNRKGTEDITQAVQDLVPILSVAVHEVLRQVAHQCAERGKVLGKVWCTYVELFNRVLNQMRESLRVERSATKKKQQELSSRRGDIEALRKAHPREIRDTIASLEETFTKQQTNTRIELVAAKKKNEYLKQEIRKLQKEVDVWYPSFPLYKDVYIKNAARRLGRCSVKLEEMTPEVAIVEELKRLLTILPSEKRMLVGRELYDLLRRTTPPETSPFNPRRTSFLTDAMEEDTTVDRLRAEVMGQEKHIRELEAELGLAASSSHNSHASPSLLPCVGSKSIAGSNICHFGANVQGEPASSFGGISDVASPVSDAA